MRGSAVSFVLILHHGAGVGDTGVLHLCSPASGSAFQALLSAPVYVGLIIFIIIIVYYYFSPVSVSIFLLPLCLLCQVSFQHLLVSAYAGFGV